MRDPRYKSNSRGVKPGADRPRRRWLRLAIAGFLALLVVGVAMAGSTSSDPKSALWDARSVSKTRGGLSASPDFQFVGQGQIVGGAGKTWLVSGVPIELDDHTQIVDNLRAGGFVILSGRISKNGTWLADRIEQSNEKDSLFTFNGPLASRDNGIWVVGDRSLVVNAQTELDSDLAANDPVLVTFRPFEDGSWLALKVEHFDEPWIEPTPTPTATLAPAKTIVPPIITAPKENRQPSVKPKTKDDDEDGDRRRDDDHHGDDRDDDDGDHEGGGDDD